MSRAYRTVLVATDFSAGGTATLRHLEALLPSDARTRVHLVHALEPVHLGAPPAPVWVDVDRVRVQDAQRALENTAARVRKRLGPAVRVDVHLAAGPAHAQICRLAEKLRADLILIGTHGRTGLPHVLLGSVAERVVRHARRPVLTVPVRGSGRR